MNSQEAHLWYVFADEVSDFSLQQVYQHLLNPEEKERHDRLAFKKIRKEFLIARALVRIGLSGYTDVNPADWKFKQNAYGRPEILFPEISPRLYFSLSHSHGVIACLFAGKLDIGMDVECIERPGELQNMARRFFSPSEFNSLQSLTMHEQRSRFFDYWTLKEAYLKARGMGLSLPLDGFSFQLQNNEIHISFEPQIQDDPHHWQFSLFDLSMFHRAAVAICHKNTMALVIVKKRVSAFSLDASWRLTYDNESINVNSG